MGKEFKYKPNMPKTLWQEDGDECSGNPPEYLNEEAVEYQVNNNLITLEVTLVVQSIEFLDSSDDEDGTRVQHGNENEDG